MLASSFFAGYDFLRCILLSLAHTSSDAPPPTEGYHPCSSPLHIYFVRDAGRSLNELYRLVVAHKSG